MTEHGRLLLDRMVDDTFGEVIQLFIRSQRTGKELMVRLRSAMLEATRGMTTKEAAAYRDVTTGCIRQEKLKSNAVNGNVSNRQRAFPPKDTETLLLIVGNSNGVTLRDLTDRLNKSSAKMRTPNQVRELMRPLCEQHGIRLQDDRYIPPPIVDVKGINPGSFSRKVTAFLRAAIDVAAGTPHAVVRRWRLRASANWPKEAWDELEKAIDEKTKELEARYGLQETDPGYRTAELTVGIHLVPGPIATDTNVNDSTEEGGE